MASQEERPTHKATPDQRGLSKRKRSPNHLPLGHFHGKAHVYVWWALFEICMIWGGYAGQWVVVFW